MIRSGGPEEVLYCWTVIQEYEPVSSSYLVCPFVTHLSSQGELRLCFLEIL